MAETEEKPPEPFAEPINRIKREFQGFVEDFDIRSATNRLEEFGRKNPVGLALGAFTVGLAAGLIMRKRLPMD